MSSPSDETNTRIRHEQLKDLASDLDKLLFEEEAVADTKRPSRVSEVDNKDLKTPGKTPEGADDDEVGGDDEVFETAVRMEIEKRWRKAKADVDALKVAAEEEIAALKESAMEDVDERAIKFIATTVAKTMENRNLSPKKPSTPRAAENTVTVNGMQFRTVPRTESEVDADRVLMTKEERFELEKSDKEKVRKSAIASLKTKFQHLDYGELLNGSAGDALGKMLLAAQTTAESFIKWNTSYDTRAIFQMPICDDYSDVLKLANAPKIDLLKDYKRVSGKQVWQWQEAVNLLLPRADVESSSWVQDKLENSIEDNLQLQLKQSLSRLPDTKRGGVSTWYALAVSLDANDHEHKKLVIDYIEKHLLTDTDGEDVATSSSCFVAAARALKLQDVPSDIIEIYLNSMGTSQSPEFNQVVQSLLGHHHAIGSDMDTSPSLLLDKLDVFSTKLSAKYRAYLKNKKWPAAGATAGGFKAALVGNMRDSNKFTQPPANVGLVPPSPKWQAWFDRQNCGKCGQRGHPDKYCEDRGARNRPYRPFNRLPNERNRQGQAGRRVPVKKPEGGGPRSRTLSFKSDAAKKDFQRKVYQAWEEFGVPEDQELMAHLAGEAEGGDAEPEMYVNIAEDGGDYDSGGEEYGGTDEDAMAHVFAAAGLESLNWKAA